MTHKRCLCLRIVLVHTKRQIRTPRYMSKYSAHSKPFGVRGRCEVVYFHHGIVIPAQGVLLHMNRPSRAPHALDGMLGDVRQLVIATATIAVAHNINNNAKSPDGANSKRWVLHIYYSTPQTRGSGAVWPYTVTTTW